MKLEKRYAVFDGENKISDTFFNRQSAINEAYRIKPDWVVTINNYIVKELMNNDQLIKEAEEYISDGFIDLQTIRGELIANLLFALRAEMERADKLAKTLNEIKEHGLSWDETYNEILDQHNAARKGI